MTRPVKLQSAATARSKRRALKFAMVCLLPMFAILFLAETIVRVGGFDRPLAGAIVFGGPDDPIHRTDSLLFFRLSPNLRTTWQGAQVTTNRLGLRGRDVDSKGSREFRILSLGESSTFGALVGDDETYSARLEKYLQQRDDRHNYRVLNAGVSGYSSFQSLKYLEHRGLALKPDLVLFYHEINDAQTVEFSDQERFDSYGQSWHRKLADHWAVYRVLSALAVNHKLSQLRTSRRSVAVEVLPSREDPQEITDQVRERPLRVPRVSPDERQQIFARLADLCSAQNVELVFIHPSYAASKAHSCELTEFCHETHTNIFEAYDFLHPAEVGPGDYFADECHPNRQGHDELAKGLLEYLVRSQLLPSQSQ